MSDDSNSISDLFDNLNADTFNQDSEGGAAASAEDSDMFGNVNDIDHRATTGGPGTSGPGGSSIHKNNNMNIEGFDEPSILDDLQNDALGNLKSKGIGNQSQQQNPAVDPGITNLAVIVTLAFAFGIYTYFQRVNQQVQQMDRNRRQNQQRAQRRIPGESGGNENSQSQQTGSEGANATGSNQGDNPSQNQNQQNPVIANDDDNLNFFTMVTNLFTGGNGNGGLNGGNNNGNGQLSASELRELRLRRLAEWEDKFCAEASASSPAVSSGGEDSNKPKVPQQKKTPSPKSQSNLTSSGSTSTTGSYGGYDSVPGEKLDRSKLTKQSAKVALAARAARGQTNSVEGISGETQQASSSRGNSKGSSSAAAVTVNGTNNNTTVQNQTTSTWQCEGDVCKLVQTKSDSKPSNVNTPAPDLKVFIKPDTEDKLAQAIHFLSPMLNTKESSNNQISDPLFFPQNTTTIGDLKEAMYAMVIPDKIQKGEEEDGYIEMAGMEKEDSGGGENVEKDNGGSGGGSDSETKTYKNLVLLYRGRFLNNDKKLLIDVGFGKFGEDIVSWMYR